MFPLVVIPAVIGISFLAGCSGSKKSPKPEEESPPAPIFDPPCSGDLFSESFGSETLSLCHVDGNHDGTYQALTDDLSAWDGKQWASFKNVESFKAYQEKFGLPNFEGLNVRQWTWLRSFVYLSPSKRWSLDWENRITEIAQSHVQKGINLGESVQAGFESIEWLRFPSVRQNFDRILVLSVLNFVKAKQPDFYGEHRDFIDLVSKKIEQRKLKFPGEPDKIAGDLPAASLFDAFYVPASNEIYLGNDSIRDLDGIDSWIIHELSHFDQDIRREPLTKVGKEDKAYLIQADYMLAKAGLYQGEFSPEKLEAFIEDFRKKKELPKPATDREGDTPPVFALRAAYFQRYQQKPLEEESLRRLTYSNEYTAVVVDLMNFYGNNQAWIEQNLKATLGTVRTAEELLGKIDVAIQKETQELEKQLVTYKSLNSIGARSDYYTETLSQTACKLVSYYDVKASYGGSKEERERGYVSVAASISGLYFNAELPSPTDGVE